MRGCGVRFGALSSGCGHGSAVQWLSRGEGLGPGSLPPTCGAVLPEDLGTGHMSRGGPAPPAEAWCPVKDPCVSPGDSDVAHGGSWAAREGGGQNSLNRSLDLLHVHQPRIRGPIPAHLGLWTWSLLPFSAQLLVCGETGLATWLFQPLKAALLLPGSLCDANVFEQGGVLFPESHPVCVLQAPPLPPTLACNLQGLPLPPP